LLVLAALLSCVVAVEEDHGDAATHEILAKELSAAGLDLNRDDAAKLQDVVNSVVKAQLKAEAKRAAAFGGNVRPTTARARDLPEITRLKAENAKLKADAEAVSNATMTGISMKQATAKGFGRRRARREPKREPRAKHANSTSISSPHHLENPSVRIAEVGPTSGSTQNPLRTRAASTSCSCV